MENAAQPKKIGFFILLQLLHPNLLLHPSFQIPQT